MFKGLTGLTSLWSQDMAIDLGTANTLVVLKDQGDNPVFIRVTLEDGTMCWTSPIYLYR